MYTRIDVKIHDVSIIKPQNVKPLTLSDLNLSSFGWCKPKMTYCSNNTLYRALDGD